MQWMARGRNGGYFEMMVGGRLIHRGSLLPEPREPLLSPPTPASSHRNMSNPQKVSSPSVSLHIFKTSPSQISPLLVLIRWPRPLCIYSLPSHKSTQCVQTPGIVCVGIHYLSADLSIPPPHLSLLYPELNQE